MSAENSFQNSNKTTEIVEELWKLYGAKRRPLPSQIAHGLTEKQMRDSLVCSEVINRNDYENCSIALSYYLNNFFALDLTLTLNSACDSMDVFVKSMEQSKLPIPFKRIYTTSWNIELLNLLPRGLSIIVLNIQPVSINELIIIANKFRYLESLYIYNTSNLAVSSFQCFSNHPTLKYLYFRGETKFSIEELTANGIKVDFEYVLSLHAQQDVINSVTTSVSQFYEFVKNILSTAQNPADPSVSSQIVNKIVNNRKACSDAVVPSTCTNCNMLVSTLRRLFDSQFVDKLDILALIIARQCELLSSISEDDLNDWIGNKIDTEAITLNKMTVHQINQKRPQTTSNYDYFCSVFVNSLVVNRLAKGFHEDKLFANLLSKLSYSTLVSWTMQYVTMLDLSKTDANDADVCYLLSLFPRLQLFCVCDSTLVTSNGIANALIERDQILSSGKVKKQNDRVTLLLCGNKNIHPSILPSLLSQFRVNIEYSPFTQKLRDSIEITVRSICLSFSLSVQAEFETMKSFQGKYFTEISPRLVSLVQAFLAKQQNVIDALKKKVDKEKENTVQQSDMNDIEDEITEQFSEPELRRNVSRCCVQYLSTSSLAIFCEVGTRLFIKKVWEDQELTLPETISELTGDDLLHFRKDEAEVNRIWDELWTTRIAAHFLFAFRSSAFGLRSQSIIAIPQSNIAKASPAQRKEVEPAFTHSSIDVIETLTASVFHFRSIFSVDDENESEVFTYKPESIAYAALFKTFFDELIENQHLVDQSFSSKKSHDDTNSSKFFIVYTPSFRECLTLFKTKGKSTAEDLETFFSSFLLKRDLDNDNSEIVRLFKEFYTNQIANNSYDITLQFSSFLKQNLHYYFSPETTTEKEKESEFEEGDIKEICNLCNSVVLQLRRMHTTLGTLIKKISDQNDTLSSEDLLLLYSISVRTVVFSLFIGFPSNIICLNPSLLVSQLTLVSLISTDPLPLLLLTANMKINGILPYQVISDDSSSPYIRIIPYQYDESLVAMIWKTLMGNNAQRSIDEAILPDEVTQSEFFCTLFKHYFVLSVTQSSDSEFSIFTTWERLVFELGASSYLLAVDLDNIECNQKQLTHVLEYANRLNAPVRVISLKGINLHGFDFSFLPETIVSANFDNCDLSNDDLVNTMSVIGKRVKSLSVQNCCALQDNSIISLFDLPELNKLDISGNLRISNDAKNALKKRNLNVISDLFTEKILSIIHSFEIKSLRMIVDELKSSILKLKANNISLSSLGSNNDNLSFCSNFPNVDKLLWKEIPISILSLLDEIHYPYMTLKSSITPLEIILHCVKVITSHICAVSPSLVIIILSRMQMEKDTKKLSDSNNSMREHMICEISKKFDTDSSMKEHELIRCGLTYDFVFDYANTFALASQALDKSQRKLVRHDPLEDLGFFVHFYPPIPLIDFFEKPILENENSFAEDFITTMLKVFITEKFEVNSFDDLSENAHLLWTFSKPFIKSIDFGVSFNFVFAKDVLSMISEEQIAVKKLILTSELLLKLLFIKTSFPKTISTFQINGTPFRVENLPTFPKSAEFSFFTDPECALDVAIGRICKLFNEKFVHMFESIEPFPEGFVEVAFCEKDELNNHFVVYKRNSHTPTSPNDVFASASFAFDSRKLVSDIKKYQSVNHSTMQKTSINSSIKQDQSKNILFPSQYFVFDEVYGCTISLMKAIKVELKSLCKFYGLNEAKIDLNFYSFLLSRGFFSCSVSFLLCLEFFSFFSRLPNRFLLKMWQNIAHSIEDFQEREHLPKTMRQILTHLSFSEEGEITFVSKEKNEVQDDVSFRIIDNQFSTSFRCIVLGELFSSWFKAKKFSIERFTALCTAEHIHSLDLSHLPLLASSIPTIVDEIVFFNPSQPPIFTMSTIEKREHVKSICFVNCPNMSEADLRCAIELFGSVTHLALIIDEFTLKNCPLSPFMLLGFEKLTSIALSPEVKSYFLKKIDEEHKDEHILSLIQNAKVVKTFLVE